MQLSASEQRKLSKHRSVNNRLRTVLKDYYKPEHHDPVKFSYHEKEIRSYGETIIEGRFTVDGRSIRLGEGRDQTEPYVELPLNLPMYDHAATDDNGNKIWRLTEEAQRNDYPKTPSYVDCTECYGTGVAYGEPCIKCSGTGVVKT